MLNGNKITDITPISNLPKLVYVTLGGNTIKALPSMKNLIKLESLYIGFNQIKDISSIADFAKHSIHRFDGEFCCRCQSISEDD